MDEQKEPKRYDEYEHEWLRRHKGSIVRMRRVSSWGLIFGICLWSVIAVGAALISGAHSIPAILLTIPRVVESPLRERLSLAGFTILELLIFAGAMYRKEARVAVYALVLAMTGALAANIGSSVVATQQNGGDWLNFIVAVILALIAPTAAFLAGEMVHQLKEKHDAIIAAAMLEYETKRRDLDVIINREYTKYVKEFEKAVQLALSAGTGQDRTKPDDSAVRPVSVRTDRTGYGYARTSDAQQKALDWFNANPDKASTPLRDLEGIIGIGKSTIGEARKEWQRQQSLILNGNGNGSHD